MQKTDTQDRRPTFTVMDFSPQVLAKLSLGCMLINAGGEIFWANERQKDFTGLAPEQLLGKSLRTDVVLRASGLLDIWRMVMATGAHWSNICTRLAFTPHAPQVCHVEMIPISFDKQLQGVAILMGNKYNTRFQQPVRQENDREIKLMLEDHPSVLFLIDSDYRIQWVSKGFHKRYSEMGDFSVHHCYQLLYDLNSPCPSCPAEEWFNQKTPITEERPYCVKAQAIKDANGHIVQCLVFGKDSVKVNKMLEHDFNHSILLSSFYENILHAIPHPLYVIDRNDSLLMVNQKGLKLLDRTKEIVIGQSLFAFQPFKMYSQLKNAVKDCWETGKEQVVEHTGPFGNDDHDALFRHRCIPLDNISGLSTVLVIGEQSDIAPEKMIQRQKQKALSDFAGPAIHHFNNILHPLCTQLDYMRSDLFSVNDIHDFSSKVAAVQNLVQEIQSFTKRIGGLKIPKEGDLKEHDLVAILDNALLIINMHHLSKTVKINTNLPKEKALLRCSEPHLESALRELLINALEAATPDGVIDIEMIIDHKLKQYRIIVFNTGAEIPKSLQHLIFEPFKSTKDQRDAGLGLTIVQTAIVYHNGTINVESVKNEGTRFLVTLPFTQD